MSWHGEVVAFPGQGHLLVTMPPRLRAAALEFGLLAEGVEKGMPKG
jgi:hypothetical protein